MQHSNQLSYEAMDVRNCSRNIIYQFIIGSFDFISAVQYMIHFIYHSLHMSFITYSHVGHDLNSRF